MNDGFIQSPAVWWIPALVGVVVVLVMARRRSRSKWGFKDVVRNPRRWDSLERSPADLQAAIESSRQWTGDQITSFTRHFILECGPGKEAWLLARTLESLGPRIHAIVLGLLQDRGFGERLARPSAESLERETPLARACKLLGDAPSPEAVRALAPFLAHGSKEIRKEAALGIAKVGTPDIIPWVRTALADPDEYVRSHALMGLTYALRRSALSAPTRAELYPNVLNLLQAGQNADEAAKVLHGLDPLEATAYFLSEKVLRPETPILHVVLTTLADAKVPVSPHLLRPLMAGLSGKESKYPASRALGRALGLLGQQQHPEDRDLLRGFLAHAEPQVAQGAAAGLLSSFGLDGFEQRIRSAESAAGYESLGKHPRLYRAVVGCDAEINNGGLAQYFFNSSGDRWTDAITGYRTFGLQERLAILDEAISRFGEARPSTDRKTRQGQLAKLYRRNDRIFDDLDARYYACSEDLDVFISRFVLENPDDFR